MSKVKVPQWLWIALIVWGILAFIWILVLLSSSSIWQEEYNSLLTQYNEKIETYNSLIETGVWCETGAEAYCFEEGAFEEYSENPCGEGNTLYCYRNDLNVGGCLSNERVVCQR